MISGKNLRKTFNFSYFAFLIKQANFVLLHLKKLPKYVTALINVHIGLRATYSKITQTGAITSRSGNERTLRERRKP